MEEAKVRWECAEIVWSNIQNLQRIEISKGSQMTRWNLIVRQVKRMKILEAVRNQLQSIHWVVLHVELLKGDQVHQVVHVDLIVWNVQICKILEEFKVLLRYLNDVHACQLGPDCFMRELYPARVKKEETIEYALRFHLSRDAMLNLLWVDLALFLWTISDFVVVLHFGLLLFNLNHTIQIGRFHG